MPELPEVEHARRLAEQVLRGRRLAEVRVADDAIVCSEASPSAIGEALRGRRVEAVRRHGKQLWLELDRRPWPLVHLGMAGALCGPAATPLQLASSPRQGEPATWPPRFEKLWVVTDDGGELAFTDKRRLGRLRLRQDPAAEPPVSELGFDALLERPGRATFAALARARRSPIKAVLLDQSFAAGVGNWIADEVLYQAGIDPRRLASELSDAELERVRRKLGHVIERAVAVDAVKERFPRTWLFHHRWGKTAGARTARGEPIEHMTVAGRTTAWVPSRQR